MLVTEASENSLQTIAGITRIGHSMATFLLDHDEMMEQYISWIQARFTEAGINPETCTDEKIRESVKATQDDFDRIGTNANRHLETIERARELMSWLFN